MTEEEKALFYAFYIQNRDWDMEDSHEDKLDALDSIRFGIQDVSNIRVTSLWTAIEKGQCFFDLGRTERNAIKALSELRQLISEKPNEKVTHRRSTALTLRQGILLDKLNSDLDILKVKIQARLRFYPSNNQQSIEAEIESHAAEEIKKQINHILSTQLL